MVRPLSDYHIAGLCLLIVTIPIVLVIGLGVEGQVRCFRKRGVRPLLAVMQSQAATFRSGTRERADPLSRVSAAHLRRPATGGTQYEPCIPPHI
jgi:hypothetical protein